MSVNPYLVCPSFKSEQFVYRLVQEEDAADLLECYSDPASIPLFNSDNCHNDFNYQTIEEMSSCIRVWLEEYKGQGYIRFSIVEMKRNKAIGTIEFFAKRERVEGLGYIGILRLDLLSSFESEGNITEILSLIEKEFYDYFDVDAIITKAISKAETRILVLLRRGYSKIKETSWAPINDYYIIMRHKREA